MHYSIGDGSRVMERKNAKESGIQMINRLDIDVSQTMFCI